MPQTTAHEFTLTTIDGDPLPLSRFSGKVLLIVNVASECGFTPQYIPLQELHETYADRGLVVLGVPANEFGKQEPGSNQEIAQFCESRFGVTFVMTEKIVVQGEGQHPLYRWLTSEKGEVSWNFNKFLIDRDGRIVEHYESKIEPLSPELTGAIERLL